MRLSRKFFAADKINFLTGTASAAMISRSGIIYGWAFEETTGAATAQLELIDGDSNNGDRIVPITLLANESTRDVFGQPGIWCDRGVYCRVLSGSIRGTVYYQSLTEDEIIALLDLQYPGAQA